MLSKIKFRWIKFIYIQINKWHLINLTNSNNLILIVNDDLNRTRTFLKVYKILNQNFN